MLRTSGACLNYCKTGTGPAVLLIQGAGVIGECWRPQIAGLSHLYTLIWFDNRGIGGSEMNDGMLSIEIMAADALAIMDAEGIDRFHLVGHSMGGLIAQQIALTARRRVISLALLCTFRQGREAARLSPGILATALRMRIGTRPMRQKAFIDLVLPAEYLRTVDRAHVVGELQRLFGHDLADQPPIVVKQLRAMSRYNEATRLSELTRLATLVVSARHDRIALPQYGRALASAIQGARFVEFPDAGHGVTIQCADAINGLLREHFLAADPVRQREESRHVMTSQEQ
jgi:pimeloyl-ACP methyl ester carboxylesterase